MLADLSSVVLVFVWLWFLLKRLFEVSDSPVRHASCMTLTWIGVAIVRLVQPVYFWICAREFTPQTVSISILSLGMSIVGFFMSYHMRRFVGFSASVMMSSVVNFLAVMYYSYVL